MKKSAIIWLIAAVWALALTPRSVARQPRSPAARSLMPPPVPTKPVPKPMVRPKNKEIATPFQSSFSPFPAVFFLLVSGLTRKRMPMQKVRKSVKLPSTTLPL